MSVATAIIKLSKKGQLMSDSYILMEYNLNGYKVVSAIHYLDLSKFRSEHPDAKPFIQK